MERGVVLGRRMRGMIGVLVVVAVEFIYYKRFFSCAEFNVSVVYWLERD